MWITIPNAAATGDTFIGALNHPSAPLNKTADLLDHMEAAVIQIQQDFPNAHITPAGDLNSLSDAEAFIRTVLTSTVNQLTSGNNNLDRL